VDAILELGLLNAVLAAVLALVVLCVTWICRRPALAHALWLLVLIKLITPPFWPIEVPWPQSMGTEPEPEVAPQASVAAQGPIALAQPEGQFPEAPEAAGEGEQLPPLPADGAGAAPLPEAPPLESISWQTAVAALWLAGACCWWCLAAWRLGRFRRLLRAAYPASPDVHARAKALAARLGLARCPNVRLLAAPLPPLLWSLLGPPCVFLPERLWAVLTDEQQDTLLVHELVHLQRRDHWVRWLELLALGLYWWHPAVWCARRRLHEAAELLCDARVLRTLPGAAAVYAQALIQTVAFLSGPRLALPGAASGMGQVRPLKARVTMIMRGTNADRLPRAGAWALLALGLAALVLRPAWAPSPARADEGPDQPAAAPAPQLVKPAPTGAEKPLFVDPFGEDVKGRYPPAHALLIRPPGVPAANFQGVAEGQVELLRAQLQGKQAELQEAGVLLKHALLRLERSENLQRKGMISQEQIEMARADVEIQEARLLGKEAQVREAELRLALAARSLPQPRPGGPPRGMGPANASGSRASARPGLPGAQGPGSGAPSPLPGPPAAPQAVPGQPALPGSPGGFAPGGTAAGKGGSRGRTNVRTTEERVLQLEQKLDILLREVERLRSQMSGPGRGGPPAAEPESSEGRTFPRPPPVQVDRLIPRK